MYLDCLGLRPIRSDYLELRIGFGGGTLHAEVPPQLPISEELLSQSLKGTVPPTFCHRVEIFIPARAQVRRMICRVPRRV